MIKKYTKRSLKMRGGYAFAPTRKAPARKRMSPSRNTPRVPPAGKGGGNGSFGMKGKTKNPSFVVSPSFVNSKAGKIAAGVLIKTLHSTKEKAIAYAETQAQKGIDAVISKGKEIITNITWTPRTPEFGGGPVSSDSATVLRKLPNQGFGSVRTHTRTNVFGNSKNQPSISDGAFAVKQTVFKDNHLRATEGMMANGQGLYFSNGGIVNKSRGFRPVKSDVGGKVVFTLPPVTTAIPNYMLRSACTLYNVNLGGDSDTVKTATSVFEDSGASMNDDVISGIKSKLSPYFPYKVKNKTSFTNLNSFVSCEVTVHWCSHQFPEAENVNYQLADKVWGNAYSGHPGDVDTVPLNSKAFLEGNILYQGDTNELQDNTSYPNSEFKGGIGWFAFNQSPGTVQGYDPGIMKNALQYLENQNAAWISSPDDLSNENAGSLQMRCQSAYNFTATRGFEKNFVVHKTDKQILKPGEVFVLDTTIYKNECFDNYSNLIADKSTPYGVSSNQVWPLIEIKGVQTSVMQYDLTAATPTEPIAQRSNEIWLRAAAPAEVAISTETSITNYLDSASLNRPTGGDNIQTQRFYSRTYNQDYTNQVFQGRKPVITHTKMISSAADEASAVTGTYFHIPIANPDGTLKLAGSVVNRVIT